MSRYKMSVLWDELEVQDLIKKALEQPDDVIFRIQDAHGDTLLIHAIRRGLEETITELINRTPNPSIFNISNDWDISPLHFAVKNSDDILVRKLVLAGASNEVGTYRFTPLHLACAYRDMDCIKALTDPVTTEEEELLANNYTDEGFQPQLPPDFDSQAENTQMTAFHISVHGGHLEAVQHMFRLGADPETYGGRVGMTALHMATTVGQLEIVRFLANEAGASLIAKTLEGNLTAYDIAIRKKFFDIAKEVNPSRH